MLDQPGLVELLAPRQRGLRDETPIEPPKLRATLISAEAWSVLSGGMPS